MIYVINHDLRVYTGGIWPSTKGPLFFLRNKIVQVYRRNGTEVPIKSLDIVTGADQRTGQGT